VTTKTPRDDASATILILFDGYGYGATETLAHDIAAGAASVAGVKPRVARIDESEPEILDDIDALVIGSPNWSGITGKMKAWFDGTGELWERGALNGIPGAAFCASRGRSSGTEATLLQIIHLLLANGLYIVGLPWSDAMETSGSYYGATVHGRINDLDRAQARELGKRVATVAVTLKRS